MLEHNATEARLLLVDDTPANLHVLCELLEARGYNISIALSGQQALDIARQATPDFVAVHFWHHDVE